MELWRLFWVSPPLGRRRVLGQKADLIAFYASGR